jgi:tape measure domain-containing protein
MASKLEFDASVNSDSLNKLLAELRSGAEGAARAINDALGGQVKKTIVFEEKVDASGSKQLVAVEKERLTIADQILNKQVALNKVQSGSVTSLRQQVNTLKQQRDGVAKYEQSINGIGLSVRKQSSEWTGLNTKISGISRELAIAEASGFWQQLKVATQAQGIINVGNGISQIVQILQSATIIVGQFVSGINSVINSAAELQSIGLTFKAIGVGASGANFALQEASRISLGLGTDLQTVQEGFRQLSPVILNIGGSLSDVSSVTETLSSRFAAFGISGDKARRVMQGVIQAFAKGKLQAEELTQQISEADPAFKTDFTKALFEARKSLGSLGRQVDGTVGNLEKLVKAGKITGDVLLKVLPGLSKSSILFGKLGDSAGSAVSALERNDVTIDQVKSNFKTLNQLSLRNLATSVQPLINAFLGLEAVVVDFFSRLSKSAAISSLGAIGADAVDALARLADSFFIVIEGAATLVGAFKPLLDLIANTPGVFEVAGVALLAKFLRPLNLLDKRIEKTKTVWRSFGETLNTVFTGPTAVDKQVSNITQKIGGFQSLLAGPTTKGAASTGIESIGSSAEAAIASVGNLGARTADQINASIVKTENRIAKLREALAVDPGANGLSSREIKRQENLRSQIEKSNNALQSLYAEQARQGQASIQSRRQITGFNPDTIASEKRQLQRLIEIQKKADKEQYRQANGSENIQKQKQFFNDKLAQIEKNRIRDVSTFGEQAYSGGYRTEEVNRYKNAISDLDAEQKKITLNAQRFADKQNDVAKIFADGSKEGASFEERQKAIALATRLTSTAIDDNGKKITELKDKYKALKDERKNIIEAQAQSSFTGSGPSPAAINLSSNQQEASKTRSEIAQLRLENIQGIKVQRELSLAQDENIKIGRNQSNVFSGIKANAAGLAGTIGNNLSGAFSGLKDNLTGLFGLLDPLTATFIAIGLVTRLYTDGSKDAAKATSDYKIQIDLLKTAQENLVPGLTQNKEKANATESAWDALAVTTVKLVDQIGSGLNKAFEFSAGVISKFKVGVSELPPQLAKATEAFSAFALVAAGGTLGAAIGSIVPGIGTAIGAIVGGSAAAIAALALSSDAASVKLEKLKKELIALKQGSAGAAAASTNLASGLLKEVNLRPGKDGIPAPDVQKLKDGAEAIGSAINQIKNDILQLEGTKVSNLGKWDEERAKLTEYRAELARLQAVQASQKQDSRVTILGTTQGNEAAAALNETSLAIKDYQEKIKNSEGTINSFVNQNKEIASAGLPQLTARLKEAEAAQKKLTDAYASSEQTNRKYINTIGEISNEIKILQGDNEGLKLTDSQDAATLDANLTKIKDFQKIAEALGKTKIEIQLELKTARQGIQDAQLKQNIPEGIVREYAQIATEANRQVSSAGETFRADAQRWTDAVKSGKLSQQEANKQIELAGTKYVEATETAKANLIDAGKKLQLSLKESQTSLSGLRLSKPEFFSPSELRQSAEQVNKAYEDALIKVRKQTGDYNFTPKLEGTTPEEILKSKQSFIETRQQADKLTESIDQILKSLQTISQTLQNIAGKPVQDLKKYGQDYNKTLKDATESTDKLNKKTKESRIGEIFGEIEANGKKVILYYDKITNQTESVSKAEFEAIKRAEALGKAGENIGKKFDKGSKDAVKGLSEISGQANFINTGSSGIGSTTPSVPTAPASASASGPAGFTVFPSINEEEGNRRFAAAAQRVGGNFNKVLQNVISTGGEGSFPLGKLGAIQEAATTYNQALKNLTLSQQQATSAQTAYDQAIANGSSEAVTLAGNLKNANLALSQSNLELDSAKINYDAASKLARQLGVDINSVPNAGEYLQGPPAAAQESLQQWIDKTNELKNLSNQGNANGILLTQEQLNQSLGEFNNYVGQVQTGLANLGNPESGATYQDPTAKINQGAQELITTLSEGSSAIDKLSSAYSNAGDTLTQASSALDTGVTSADAIAGSLQTASNAASSIQGNINKLGGSFTVTGNIVGPRWAGGPVTGGESYQVNELGKEGFLNNFGVLKPINKPANAIWQAPTSGTVIPAHIMSELNVPSTGVKVSDKPGAINSLNSENGLSRIARRIEASIVRNESLNNNSELAIVQSRQAIEIGNLSRAVDKLTSKKWNVNVNVNASGSTGYLNTLSQRL